jgi:hypothetical protein
VRIGSHDYQSAYYCNLQRNGTGDLTFDLEGAYTTLTLTIGVTDDSNPVHMIEFAIIGDEKVDLVPRETLSAGGSHTLSVNVAGITRLRLQVTERSGSSGNGASSRPVWAEPTLLKS